MAFTVTLQNAKTSTLKNVAAACTDSSQFVDLVNEATRRLLKRGNWQGTEWLARFEVQGCVITWPKWVAAVEGVRFCHDRPAQIWNNHYQFVGPTYRHLGCYSGAVMADVNPSPVQFDITGNQGKVVQLYATKANDITN